MKKAAVRPDSGFSVHFSYSPLATLSNRAVTSSLGALVQKKPHPQRCILRIRRKRFTVFKPDTVPLPTLLALGHPPQRGGRWRGNRRFGFDIFDILCAEFVEKCRKLLERAIFTRICSDFIGRLFAFILAKFAPLC